MTAEASVPTPEQLQQLKRVREAALIRKWTSGRSLTPEEMSEVAHILPAKALASPPAPKTRYEHPYSHYAAKLGYAERSLKRLVNVGRKARVPPPFDELEKLADWWERMRTLGYLKQQVPARIVDYVASCQQVRPAGADTDPAGTPAEPAKPPPPSTEQSTSKIDFAQLEAIGLEGAVRELTIQLSAAQLDLRKAREEGAPDVTISRRQKTFDTTLDSLRKTEKSWQDLQKSRGDLAPVSEFRKDLTTIATTLRGMIKRRADNICAAVAGILDSEQLGILRAAVVAEGERDCALLRSARHWKRDSDGSIITDA